MSQQTDSAQKQEHLAALGLRSAATACEVVNSRRLRRRINPEVTSNPDDVAQESEQRIDNSKITRGKRGRRPWRCLNLGDRQIRNRSDNGIEVTDRPKLLDQPVSDTEAPSNLDGSFVKETLCDISNESISKLVNCNKKCDDKASTKPDTPVPVLVKKVSGDTRSLRSSSGGTDSDSNITNIGIKKVVDLNKSKISSEAHMAMANQKKLSVPAGSQERLSLVASSSSSVLTSNEQGAMRGIARRGRPPWKHLSVFRSVNISTFNSPGTQLEKNTLDDVFSGADIQDQDTEDLTNVNSAVSKQMLSDVDLNVASTCNTNDLQAAIIEESVIKIVKEVVRDIAVPCRRPLRTPVLERKSLISPGRRRSSVKTSSASPSTQSKTTLDGDNSASVKSSTPQVVTVTSAVSEQLDTKLDSANAVVATLGRGRISNGRGKRGRRPKKLVGDANSTPVLEGAMKPCDGQKAEVSCNFNSSVQKIVAGLSVENTSELLSVSLLSNGNSTMEVVGRNVGDVVSQENRNVVMPNSAVLENFTLKTLGSSRGSRRGRGSYANRRIVSHVVGLRSKSYDCLPTAKSVKKLTSNELICKSTGDVSLNDTAHSGRGRGKGRGRGRRQSSSRGRGRRTVVLVGVDNEPFDDGSQDCLTQSIESEQRVMTNNGATGSPIAFNESYNNLSMPDCPTDAVDMQLNNNSATKKPRVDQHLDSKMRYKKIKWRKKHPWVPVRRKKRRSVVTLDNATDKAANKEISVEPANGVEGTNAEEKERETCVLRRQLATGDDPVQNNDPVDMDTNNNKDDMEKQSSAEGSHNNDVPQLSFVDGIKSAEELSCHEAEMRRRKAKFLRNHVWIRKKHRHKKRRTNIPKDLTDTNSCADKSKCESGGVVNECDQQIETATLGFRQALPKTGKVIADKRKHRYQNDKDDIEPRQKRHRNSTPAYHVRRLSQPSALTSTALGEPVKSKMFTSLPLRQAKKPVVSLAENSAASTTVFSEQMQEENIEKPSNNALFDESVCTNEPDTVKTAIARRGRHQKAQRGSRKHLTKESQNIHIKFDEKLSASGSSNKSVVGKEKKPYASEVCIVPCSVTLVDFAKCVSLVKRQASGNLVESAAMLPINTVSKRELKYTELCGHSAIEQGGAAAAVNSTGKTEGKKRRMIGVSTFGQRTKSNQRESNNEKIKSAYKFRLKKKRAAFVAMRGKKPFSAVANVVLPVATLRLKKMEGGTFTIVKSSGGEKSQPEPLCRQLVRLKQNEEVVAGAGVKSYACVHCNFHTRFRSSIVNHIYLHTKIVPFSCGYCGSKFGCKSGVYVHNRRDHTGQPVKICQNERIDEQKHFSVQLNDSSSSIETRHHLPLPNFENGPKRSGCDFVLSNAASLSAESFVMQQNETLTPDDGTGLMNALLDRDVDSTSCSCPEGRIVGQLICKSPELLDTATTTHCIQESQLSRKDKLGLADSIPLMIRVPESSMVTYCCKICSFSCDSLADMDNHTRALHMSVVRYSCPSCLLFISNSAVDVCAHSFAAHETVCTDLQPDKLYYTVCEGEPCTERSDIKNGVPTIAGDNKSNCDDSHAVAHSDNDDAVHCNTLKAGGCSGASEAIDNEGPLPFVASSVTSLEFVAMAVSLDSNGCTAEFNCLPTGRVDRSGSDHGASDLAMHVTQVNSDYSMLATTSSPVDNLVTVAKRLSGVEDDRDTTRTMYGGNQDSLSTPPMVQMRSVSNVAVDEVVQSDSESDVHTNNKVVSALEQLRQVCLLVEKQASSKSADISQAGSSKTVQGVANNIAGKDTVHGNENDDDDVVVVSVSLPKVRTASRMVLLPNAGVLVSSATSQLQQPVNGLSVTIGDSSTARQVQVPLSVELQSISSIRIESVRSLAAEQMWTGSNDCHLQGQPSHSTPTAASTGHRITYSCKVCLETFMCKINMAIHVGTAHDIKMVFMCFHCNTVISGLVADMLRHLATSHKWQVTDSSDTIDKHFSVLSESLWTETTTPLVAESSQQRPSETVSYAHHSTVGRDVLKSPRRSLGAIVDRLVEKKKQVSKATSQAVPSSDKSALDLALLTGYDSMLQESQHARKTKGSCPSRVTVDTRRRLSEVGDVAVTPTLMQQVHKKLPVSAKVVDNPSVITPIFAPQPPPLVPAPLRVQHMLPGMLSEERVHEQRLASQPKKTPAASLSRSPTASLSSLSPRAAVPSSFMPLTVPSAVRNMNMAFASRGSSCSSNNNAPSLLPSHRLSKPGVPVSTDVSQRQPAAVGDSVSLRPRCWEGLLQSTNNSSGKQVIPFNRSKHKSLQSLSNDGLPKDAYDVFKISSVATRRVSQVAVTGASASGFMINKAQAWNSASFAAQQLGSAAPLMAERLQRNLALESSGLVPTGGSVSRLNVLSASVVGHVAQQGYKQGTGCLQSRSQQGVCICPYCPFDQHPITYRDLEIHIMDHHPGQPVKYGHVM